MEFLERHKLAALLVLMFLCVLNLAMDAYSVYDRRQIKKEAQLSRRMLDARARIQITLINAGHRRDAFSTAEIEILKDNWTLAEYHLVAPSPFK